MNHITSPDISDNGIERAILAKGLTAPRVTPEDVERSVASEHYFTAADGVDGADINSLRAEKPDEVLTLQAQSKDPDLCSTTVIGPLSLLTFCVLVLRNGFTVIGEAACASPENFDAEIGRKVARANAIQKIWPLLGYSLKTQLHQEALNG